jgi:hypothetical protein
MKFIGLHINRNIIWTNYIDKLIPNLSGTCYADRSMCHISTTVTPASIYVEYYQFIVKYETIFGQLF